MLPDDEQKLKSTDSVKRPRIELRFHEKEYVEAIEKLLEQNPHLRRVRVDPPQPVITRERPKRAPVNSKADKYGDDKLLMHHTCIRHRRENCFELNFKNSPQFSGEKYVGRYGDMEAALAAARLILESDDHLATIAQIHASNPRNHTNYSKQRLMKRAKRLEVMGNHIKVDYDEKDHVYRLLFRNSKLFDEEQLVGVFKTESAAVTAAHRVYTSKDQYSTVREFQLKHELRKGAPKLKGNSSIDGIWKYVYWGTNKQLYFRNSPQFTGRKLIGTYDDEKTVLEVVREVLSSEDHIACIEDLKRRNPRSKKFVECIPLPQKEDAIKTSEKAAL